MTYDLLIVGHLDPVRLRQVLARIFGVPVETVDVSHVDADDRQWNAAVLCGYETVSGNVDFALDVYVADGVPELAEETFARALAEDLGVIVLYSAQPIPPSAFWLVPPDGSRTRARVDDAEPGPEGGMAMTIEAVERSVALLPEVRVAPLPEVIREHRMETPVVDGLRSWLGGEALIPEVGSDLWQALSLLGAWEGFTVRMTSGWPPDGWYPAEYYEQDLEYRDQLADRATKVPEAVAGRFGMALEQVDRLFRAGTREDPGASVDVGWWRRRVVDLGVRPGA